ncbi:M56 family metallopeptidase [Paenibacillus filicis]|uniref:M56 family metallopeptidase n=1 Tax=Paenibacillus gyeongsangnamensis TaxID=3388067 RepID=A0ABT4QCJ7_9BACL|nr:M56 family metallopeptidase [Paenibacillus filicis]MCZ8514492.1 M56 family metallopeptidase [Paenibacillus filicis]
MWENRSKTMFITGLALSGVLLVQMTLYAMHMLLGWEIRHNLIQFCTRTAVAIGWSSLVYALNLLVLYTILSLILRTGRQLLLSGRAYRRLKAAEEVRLSRMLNRRFSGGRDHIMVVEQQRPLAFTMNLLKPKIILSTGLIDLLEPEELEVVVYHEQYHRKHGDPLKTFLMSLGASVLWYIPLLPWLYHKYTIVREVLADHEAMNRLGSSAELGSALLKLLKQGEASSARRPYASVSFADTSINYRIRLILNPEEELPLGLPLTPTMISIQTTLLLGSLFFFVLP